MTDATDILAAYRLMEGKRVTLEFTSDERVVMRQVLGQVRRHPTVTHGWYNVVAAVAYGKTARLPALALLNVLSAFQLLIRERPFFYPLHPVAWRIYDALLARVPESLVLLDEGWDIGEDD